MNQHNQHILKKKVNQARKETERNRKWKVSESELINKHRKKQKNKERKKDAEKKEGKNNKKRKKSKN